MRRWVFIMLMLLLPLQGWATAPSGIYPSRCDCSGATLPAGHDAHDAALHAADDTSRTPQAADGCGPIGTTPANPGACDGDCYACHVHAMGALVARAHAPDCVHSGIARRDCPRRIAQHVPEPLLRPPTAGL